MPNIASKRGEEFFRPFDFRNDKTEQGLSPVDFHGEEGGDIGEEAKRQPSENERISLVRHENDESRAKHTEKDHVT